MCHPEDWLGHVCLLLWILVTCLASWLELTQWRLALTWTAQAAVAAATTTEVLRASTGRVDFQREADPAPQCGLESQGSPPGVRSSWSFGNGKWRVYGACRCTAPPPLSLVGCCRKQRFHSPLWRGCEQGAVLITACWTTARSAMQLSHLHSFFCFSFLWLSLLLLGFKTPAPSQKH